MELRRPTLADKEAILNMMAEFEKSRSAHNGGFWDAENFDYEDWLETSRNKEMGIGLSENRVPSIQFVLFDKSGKALGFLNLRLRLHEGLLNHAGHIGYSPHPPEQRKELSVSIKADRHADMGTIMDLKQVLREANVLNVNFTATMSRNNKLK